MPQTLDKKELFEITPIFLATNQLMLNTAREILGRMEEGTYILDESQIERGLELWEEQQEESRYILKQVPILKEQNPDTKQLKQLDELETSTLMLESLTTQITAMLYMMKEKNRVKN